MLSEDATYRVDHSLFSKDPYRTVIYDKRDPKENKNYVQPIKNVQVNNPVVSPMVNASIIVNPPINVNAIPSNILPIATTSVVAQSNQPLLPVVAPVVAQVNQLLSTVATNNIQGISASQDVLDVACVSFKTIMNLYNNKNVESFKNFLLHVTVIMKKQVDYNIKVN